MATYLARQELQRRTNILEVKDDDTDNLQFWLDLANGILSSIEFDETLDGFNVAMSFSVQRFVEVLVLNNLEEAIKTANRPFRSEKLGSYSYVKEPSVNIDNTDVFASLPPIVQAILNRYRKISGMALIRTTVFEEEIHNTATGVRQWHDLNDFELNLIRNQELQFEF